MRRATDEGGVLLEGVSKVFGALRVLDDVSLRAGPGEVVAVVGPSGCGKSTLLELSCGLQPPDAGTIRAAPAARPRPPAAPRPPSSCPSATSCSPGRGRSTTPRCRCA